MKQVLQDMERFFGTDLLLPVGSGTSGLLLTLRASGAEGRSVIVPELVCPNVAIAVFAAGAWPIVVAPRSEDYNIAAADIEPLLGPSVAAIVAVSSFGYPADFEGICALAARHQCMVIDDACQAYGGRSGGAALGTQGDIGLVSFGASKPVPAGGGGLLLARSREQLEQLRALAHAPMSNSLLQNRIAAVLMREGRHTIFRIAAERMGLLRYAFPVRAAARLPQLWAAFRAELEESAANLAAAAGTLRGIPSVVPFDYREADWLPWRLSFKAESAEDRKRIAEQLAALGVRTSTLYRPLWKYFRDVPGSARARDSVRLADRTINLVYRTTAADTRRVRDALDRLAA